MRMINLIEKFWRVMKVDRSYDVVMMRVGTHVFRWSRKNSGCDGIRDDEFWVGIRKECIWFAMKLEEANKREW